MSALAGPVCGRTWGWVGTRGTWAAASLAAMADHAVTWTALASAAVQATPISTEIPFDQAPTVTDDEIAWAVREANGLGLKASLCSEEDAAVNDDYCPYGKPAGDHLREAYHAMSMGERR